MTRIVRLEEVVHRVGYCDRELREMEREGKFPKRFRLKPEGGRAIGWFEDEIDDWLENLRKQVRGQ